MGISQFRILETQPMICKEGTIHHFKMTGNTSSIHWMEILKKWSVFPDGP